MIHLFSANGNCKRLKTATQNKFWETNGKLTIIMSSVNDWMKYNTLMSLIAQNKLF